ncbi:hypothetical protein [Vibrio parahaemolyticus]|uniref:hypothetical protein n=1 Tax=Vibrio parahaemolyticus TaxID=670 RepID=UPI00111DA8C6|nr:hypothetical protein [Vibrio parahaemolyticus]TOH16518.1 hypothetical protein CGI87_15960 [Vibrio parahaemolyticus]
MSTTKTKRKRPYSALILLFFITVFVVALALALDTDSMVNAAYSLPSLAWRLITYSIMLIKTGRETRLTLSVFAAFNEFVIWTYWTGAFPWS